MPGSLSVFDTVMKKMIELADPDTVLDIGPGGGKYGQMLRAIEAERGRWIRKMCVEVDKEHVIDRFNLAAVYDEIINEDAARLIKGYPTLTGDLVIAGDVIEHLTKSEGADLIEYLQYRFKHIFLVIPVNFISYEYMDHTHESHIAIWRTQDMARFEGAYAVERRTHDGNRFVLACVNGIMLAPADHIVVRDAVLASDRPLFYEEWIEFGYLNR